MNSDSNYTGLEIAIIGASCRFPKSSNLINYWNNLKESVSCIKFFTNEELEKSGVSEKEYRSKNYVPAKGTIEAPLGFDADFFGYTPKEAELLDPQMRLLHECSFDALQADRQFSKEDNNTGIYICASPQIKWQMAALFHQKSTGANLFSAWNLVEKDFSATRIAYSLGLNGPALCMQTACSSSLAVIHQACRSLLLGECDIALAGGASLSVPNETGYMYQDGMINSPDGLCRAFDMKAKGTVGGEGVAMVLLKPIKKAIADGNPILAIIKGSAVNNDGKRKAGYTAPSVDGQRDVINSALKFSRVSKESIGYIEAHGTGTTLGDAVEFAALNEVYNDLPENKIGLGSVKTNIGHLDSAAGIAGLLKVALMLYFKRLTPTLHFEKPNPKLGIEKSPFYMVTKTKEWTANTIRRAGVSSFGIGGTNVHMILEESPRSDEKFDFGAVNSSIYQKKSYSMISKIIAEGNYFNKTGENEKVINYYQPVWTPQFFSGLTFKQHQDSLKTINKIRYILLGKQSPILNSTVNFLEENEIAVEVWSIDESQKNKTQKGDQVLYFFDSEDSKSIQPDNKIDSSIRSILLLNGNNLPDSLSMIIDNAQTVLGNELAKPGQSSFSGLLAGLSKEYKGMNFLMVDIQYDFLFDNINIISNIDYLIRKSQNGFSNYAIRNNRIWEKSISLVNKDSILRHNIEIKKSGLYIITGGLGGIGLVLTEYLVKNFQSRVILLSRSSVESLEAKFKETNDSETGRRLQKYKEVKKTGFVKVVIVDVTHSDKVIETLTEIENQEGVINGVIHCAGSPKGMLFVQGEEHEHEQIKSSKIQGTINLYNFFKNKNNMDFMLLSSSLIVFSGAVGQTSYCMANTFMDHFANFISSSSSPFPVMSLNWDRWLQLGMAARNNGSAVYQEGLTPGEGIQAFKMMLLSGQPNLAVVAGDIFKRLQTDRKNVCGELENKSPLVIINGIIKEILGINEDIDPDTNFYDLGATSLDIIHAASKLSKCLNKSIPVTTLLTFPTINKLFDELNIDQKQPGTLNKKSDDEKKQISSRHGRFSRRLALSKKSNTGEK